MKKLAELEDKVSLRKCSSVNFITLDSAYSMWLLILNGWCIMDSEMWTKNCLSLHKYIDLKAPVDRK